MAAKLNSYFNNTGQSIGNQNERNLVQKLIDQAIQIHGFQITYVQRDEKLEGVWREDLSPEFETSFTIEAFLESYDGFEGAGMMNTAYGYSLDQLANIWISKNRWKEEYKENPTEVPKAPRSGDIILMTFGSDPSNNADDQEHEELIRPKVFEIMHTEKEPDKFQLRGEYYYSIKLRLFDHSNEDISFVNTHNNGQSEHNYLFNEEEMIKDLKTSGLDAIFANIDAVTGEETGNIVDVVKPAQNRELEIDANKYSKGRRQPSTDTDLPNKDLICDNTLDGDPFELPDKW